MSDIKIINVDQLERKINLFNNEKIFFERANNNFKTSSINRSSNINIIRHSNKLNNLYDNLSRKYEKGIRWFTEYINEVKTLENDLISGIEKPIETQTLSELDMSLPTAIPISTIISNLGLIKTINKDGSIFYSGSKDGVYYTLHLPETEITSETSLLLSFNGGGESGSKLGDFSRIHDSLGCGIITKQPIEVQNKVIVLAIQLYNKESYKKETVNVAASIIKQVQEETNINKDRTGSISHSIGGRFSAVLIAENPDLIGYATIVSPSKNQNVSGGDTFYDFDKLKDSFSKSDSPIKVIWGSGDGKAKDNGQSVAGISNVILSKLEANAVTPTQEKIIMYGNKINVYNSNNVEFIEIVGKGHGIGESVAKASFDYFLNEYLPKTPQMSASSSRSI